MEALDVASAAAARPLFLPGELCCDIEGFSLHAKVEIEARDRDGLERLAPIS